jgi:hypothetical protein
MIGEPTLRNSQTIRPPAHVNRSPIPAGRTETYRSERHLAAAVPGDPDINQRVHRFTPLQNVEAVPHRPNIGAPVWRVPQPPENDAPPASTEPHP